MLASETTSDAVVISSRVSGFGDDLYSRMVRSASLAGVGGDFARRRRMRSFEASSSLSDDDTE